MIVNYTNEGWEIIYQRAHGLLAASIAQYWKKEERPEPWLETLAAIGEHDDSQQSWHDQHHLTAQGTPQDFTLQPPDLEQAKKVTNVARVKSQWIALLISSHVHYLYADETTNNKELKEFIKDQEKFRQTTLKNLNLDKDYLAAAYRLMNWCDRTSLILCKDLLPPEEMDLEIAPGPVISSYSIAQRTQDGSLAVKPWPFEVSEFTVSVEARLLTTMVFADDAELYDALQSAPISIKKWCFKEK